MELSRWISIKPSFQDLGQSAHSTVFSCGLQKMVRWRLAATALLAIFLTVLKGGAFVVAEEEQTCSGIVPMKNRGEVVSITDFGGVGDGQTLNTAAFKSAVFHIEQRKVPEGSLLYIPAGVWLTEAFNLTSHMTLFLAEGAVIKATQVLLPFPPREYVPFFEEKNKNRLFTYSLSETDRFVIG